MSREHKSSYQALKAKLASHEMLKSIIREQILARVKTKNPTITWDRQWYVVNLNGATIETLRRLTQDE